MLHGRAEVVAHALQFGGECRRRVLPTELVQGVQAARQLLALALARDFDQGRVYTGRWGTIPRGSVWPVAEVNEDA